MTSLTTDVEIPLAGETHLLRPSLKAASTVSRLYGGFLGAQQALAQGDLAAYQAIAKAGLVSKHLSTEDLNEAVYACGVRKLAAPMMRYVSILQNGGRDPDHDDADDAQDRDEGNGEI